MARKKSKPLKRKTKTSQATRQRAAQKAAVTRGAKERFEEVKRFADAARKRYGAGTQTAGRLLELQRQARALVLEAQASTSLRGKQTARAALTRLRKAAALTFKAAVSQPTRGQARKTGWVELTSPVGGPSSTDTFSAYEHARYGASSVLSLLESRPGIVGIQTWRRVSQVERPGARQTLSAEQKERADAVAAELGMSRAEREEFDAMLMDAELYGVELELEVENYSEAAT